MLDKPVGCAKDNQKAGFAISLKLGNFNDRSYLNTFGRGMKDNTPQNWVLRCRPRLANL